MPNGDDKAGGPSDYTRGWGDCLKAVKAALGLAAERGSGAQTTAEET